MKKKIFFASIAIILVVFISIVLIKYLKQQEYKKSISNISSMNYKELTLKGVDFYDKGDYNCFIIFNSNCDLCIDEIEDIVDNIESFKNVNFYLVSNQTEEELIEYNEDSEFLGIENFTILYDKNEVFKKFFIAPEVPSIYFYNKKGELLEFKTGFTEISEIISMSNLKID